MSTREEIAGLPIPTTYAEAVEVAGTMVMEGNTWHPDDSADSISGWQDWTETEHNHADQVMGALIEIFEDVYDVMMNAWSWWNYGECDHAGFDAAAVVAWILNECPEENR